MKYWKTDIDHPYEITLPGDGEGKILAMANLLPGRVQIRDTGYSLYELDLTIQKAIEAFEEAIEWLRS